MFTLTLSSSNFAFQSGIVFAQGSTEIRSYLLFKFFRFYIMHNAAPQEVSRMHLDLKFRGEDAPQNARRHQQDLS